MRTVLCLRTFVWPGLREEFHARTAVQREYFRLLTFLQHSQRFGEHAVVDAVQFYGQKNTRNPVRRRVTRDCDFEKRTLPEQRFPNRGLRPKNGSRDVSRNALKFHIISKILDYKKKILIRIAKIKTFTTHSCRVWEPLPRWTFLQLTKIEEHGRPESRLENSIAFSPGPEGLELCV